jgi:hypothetical protein
LNLGANSQILARGDDSTASSGGAVTLQSAGTFSDVTGGQISVAGGAQGGNGGNVEISAPNVLSLNSGVDASAQPGWTGGFFALDPVNIVLGNSGSTSGGTSGIINGTSGSGTLNVNVNSAFQSINAGQILLEASGNITLSAGTTWNLFTSTGNKTSGTLTLEAGNNITFGNGASIFDPNNWSVTLMAGVNNFITGTINTAGTGNIYLNGGSGQTGIGSIQTASGSINLKAGGGIQIGSGAASSSAGNITWQAGGDIQFGDNSQITDGNSGAVTLEAGVNNFAAGTINTAGAGNIYLNGGLAGDGVGGSIQTASGSINLKAGGGIQIGSGTVSSSAGNIMWQAGGDIQFGDNSQITDGNSGAVTLEAGVNNFTTGTILPGVGNIYLNGGDGLQNGGSIQTAAGDINLTAGRDIETGSSPLQDENFNNLALASVSGAINLTAGRNIQIGSGYLETIGGNINATATSGSLNDSGSIQTDTGSITVLAGRDVLLNSSVASIVTLGLWGLVTVGIDGHGNPIQLPTLITPGGNISVTAVAGSVNAGSNPNGYIFNKSPSITTPTPYTVNTLSLGGISTAAGGDVNITAGLDIISFLPTGSTTAGDAGSGAFGPEPGNVTLTAGRNVVGHYVVADGAGTINAGVNIPQYLLNQRVVLSNPNGNAGTTSSDTGFTAGDAEPATERELALSLIDGSWTVDAAHDINLQEVRNPNGILNGINSSSSYYHLFDYTSDDFVSLDAGNSVQLLGVNPPRNSSESIPSIYPPTLDITAGAGGVVIGNEVILFPSALGSLTINTTDGGSLETPSYLTYLQKLADYDPSSGNPPPSPPADQVELIMSDSQQSQYKFNTSGDPNFVSPFGDGDYATVPVHLNNPTPVMLNVSGDMNNVYLVVPEAAQINVVGDMNNCSFKGQNLHPTDVTSINVGQTAKANMENSGPLDAATDSGLYVGGNILNQNEYNSVTLSSPPDLSLLLQANPAPYSDLFNNLFYDPNSGKLTLKGVLTSDEAAALKGLKIQEVVNGTPQVNPDGSPVLEYCYVLDPELITSTLQTPQADIDAVNLLQSESQNAPPTPNPGYVLGGGGTFDITANTLDLGSTHGIQTVGPANNPALHNYYISTLPGYIPHGAAINVILTGDLDMFATTISSLNGGNISVDVAGDVNVGSTYVPGNDQYARGIYTTVDSDVSVIAGGNIEVAGSRIAAYDGGNVTVESLHGNVDAGNGSSGSVAVYEYYVDPVTGATEFANPTIPLSGILAMTFPPRDPLSTEPAYSVGNVLVETPQGNIAASAAGIVQLPLNGMNSDAATVTVEAGSRDAHGNVLYTGNIDASGSGVVGSTVKLDATGDINGIVFARNNADINAQLNANVTVLAEGTANVSAGGNISGTIIGVGGISASGGSIDASLLSQNISPGVETSGQKGFTQGTAANNASQGLANDQTTKAAETSDDNTDPKKKKGKQVALAQKVSRVTVVLPPKKVSEIQTPNSGT